MTAAISLQAVVKTFGSTRALDGLDLEVTTGEVHAYLGPNGAGKSVTIRTLLGLLRPDSGTVELLGGDPWRDAVTLHRRRPWRREPLAQSVRWRDHRLLRSASR